MYGEEHTEWLIDSFIEEFGYKPQMHKEVCPTCGGKGTHATPALRDHGFTQSEIWEMGPDEWYEFQDDYKSGLYDVTCYECHGSNVVDVIDVEALSPQEQAYINNWYRDAAESAAISRQERAMGA